MLQASHICLIEDYVRDEMLFLSTVYNFLSFLLTLFRQVSQQQAVSNQWL